MMKKIIIYSICAIMFPLLLLSVVLIIEEFNNKIGMVYLGYLILSFVFVLYLFLNNKNKIYVIGIIVLINILYLILNLVLKNSYFGLIGLLVNVTGATIRYSNYIGISLPIVIYPLIFDIYKFDKYLLLVYVMAIIVSIIFIYYKKHHKTKIYLYDNYGD